MTIRTLILLPLLSTTTVAALVPVSSSRCTSSLAQSRTEVLLFSKLFDEEESNEESEDQIKANDGDALAKEFYRQLRERQNQESGSAERNSKFDSSRAATSNPTISRDSSDSDPRLTEEQKRDQNAKPFSKRSVVSAASTANPDTTNRNSSSDNSRRKYTGQSDSPLFGSVPPGTRERSSPRQAMMQREFQLAGTGSGLGLAIPAGIAVFALVFYIYVGLSGGIVSGGDAGAADFGGDDTIEYEQVIPVPRDTEKSVWI